MVPPVDIPLFLSGNFGELRSNHFHAGIDIKTQGIGVPVKAIKEGYIARIGISPYGYGNVLYIAHPDGTTSVYGHLEKFEPLIEAFVRERQYENESFVIDLTLSPRDLPVKKGERIALSGNSGGSAGPHLHFELRSTETEETFDPLPFFKNRIADTRAPEIRGIRVFPQPGAGIANGSTGPQTIALNTDKAGKQTLKAITAWGDIGIGVKAYDFMDKTHNTYGVKDIILKVDGSEVYHAVMDRFSFDNSRSLNSYVDWKEWVDNKQFFMKSYVEPGNFLGVNYVIRSGIININQEKTYHLEYSMKDAYENTTRFKFTIVGKRTSIPPSPNNRLRQFFAYDKYNYYSGNGIFFSIPAGNLYTDIYFTVDEVTTPQLSPYSPVYILNERVPLHSACPLTLTITNDTFPDKTKYGVVQLLPRGGRHWVGGKYNFSAITAKISELGSYTVQTDVTPPVIRPLEQEKWVANRRVSFRIMDNLSGIKFYRGTIGGEWVLFEYDAKRNLLYYNHDNARFAAGRLNKIVRQNLVLVVTDGAGNESQFTCEYPIL
ncbi:peptidase M23 [Bacteroidia bacterium]|nr:peptidase M23 [Bacteroidia bacterium]